MRFQFPLYKLFIVVAIYALALGAFLRSGSMGIIMAVVLGTSASLTILAIQEKKQIKSAVIVAAGSLAGAMYSGLFFPAMPLHAYEFNDYLGACLVMAIGATLGGLIFSWASKR